MTQGDGKPRVRVTEPEKKHVRIPKEHVKTEGVKPPKAREVNKSGQRAGSVAVSTKDNKRGQAMADSYRKYAKSQLDTKSPKVTKGTKSKPSKGRRALKGVSRALPFLGALGGAFTAFDALSTVGAKHAGDSKKEGVERVKAERSRQAYLKKQNESKSAQKKPTTTTGNSTNPALKPKAYLKDRVEVSPSKKPKPDPKKTSTSFGSAFAAARKSGKKIFTWNGKKYNTKLKGE